MNSMNDIKQWIVLRKKYTRPDGTTLGLRTGKLVSQGAHASLAVVLKVQEYEGFKEQCMDAPPYRNQLYALNVWLQSAFTKICLGVDSEQELENIYHDAVKNDLACVMITDSGLTEFAGVPTKTCLAIGPCTVEEALPIIGHLKLL